MASHKRAEEPKPKPVDIELEDRPILEDLKAQHGTYKNAVSKAIRFYHQHLGSTNRQPASAA